MGNPKRFSLTFFFLLLTLPFLLFTPHFVSGIQPPNDDIVITRSDFQALESLKNQLIDLRGVLRTWNGSRRGACSGDWAGVRCVSGQVVAVQLPFKGLAGRITTRIGQLRGLRKLSLHDNLISGTIPSSLASLPNLRGLYLFNNRLSGSVPPSIGSCPQLQSLDLSNNLLTGVIPSNVANPSRIFRLNLSFNSFHGPIPDSIPNSPSLTLLDLQHNNLSGSIPRNWGKKNTTYHLRFLALNHNRITGVIPDDLGNLSNLTSFNVSFNDLSGIVPPLLSKKFNSTSFIGNLHLCGYSVSTPCPSSPPPEEHQHQHHHKKRKASSKDIILILVGIFLVILLSSFCILLFCLCRKIRKGSVSGGEKAAPPSSGAAAAEGGKLVLFDGPIVFTAEDLLSATAEIMAKTAYGTVYKATLEDGSQVAVKRLKEKLAKPPKEFEIEVAAIGGIRHPNLLALRAYYIGPKGEKLLVYDYLPQGSLSAFLHGKTAVIDWPTRMKIAMGITRGLNHLHTQENLIHGSLTSSEVYIDDKTNAKIADYGISRLMTEAANSNVIATGGSSGYSAPELLKQKVITVKTDVYSLGIIMLELLTGKAAGEVVDGVDLAEWVASTIKEEWTNEVFDLELMKDVSSTGDEMVSTLKLALHLVDPSPDARPDVEQVLQQLEEINPNLASAGADDTTQETHA